jgi:uncharacterized membrane protein YozB (DUF420 family)
MDRLSKPGSRLALAGLIAFCTAWRLPGLADPPWINDEGVYATIGRALLAGEDLYRQVWENKPPGIYLLFAAVQWIVGGAHLLAAIRAVAALSSIITLVALYALVTPRAGRATARLAVALAGMGLDLPLLDGLQANAEIFLIAGTTTGMALLWPGRDRRPPAQVTVLVAGMAFGLAILFKLVAGADLLAALAILRSRRLERPWRASITLLAGAALPLVAVVLWLAARGLLGDTVYATVGYNRGYVATGQTLHAPMVTVLSVLVPVALLAGGVVLHRQARRRQRPAGGAAACWWLALAIVGALASGRSYLHYYLEAIPPLAICLSLVLREAMRALTRQSGIVPARSEIGPPGAPRPASAGAMLRPATANDVPVDRALARILAGLLLTWTMLVPLVAVLAMQGETVDSPPGSHRLAYYAHFWQYATGALTYAQYADRVDSHVGRNLAVADYLARHPARPRRVYVWGNAPWIYFLSHDEHATRFLSAYYNPPIPGGMSQVVTSLRADPPPYIVVVEPPLPASPAIAALLQSRYDAVSQIRDAVIYRLRTPR